MKKNVKTRLKPYKVIRTEEVWESIPNNKFKFCKSQVKNIGCFWIGGFGDITEEILQKELKSMKKCWHFNDKSFKKTGSVTKNEDKWIIEHTHFLSTSKRVCRLEIIFDEEEYNTKA